MNDQQHKQPWRKSKWLTVEGKDGLSAMSLDKKTVWSINNFENGKPVCKPDTHKTKLREWIDQWEWRWWINTNTEKKSRWIYQQIQQKTTATKRTTRTQMVKDWVDRSANIYQRNYYQPEREMDPWIPEYDSDE